MKNIFNYSHIESLLNKHNDKLLELVIVYVERVVASLAIMGGSLAIIKFSNVISPYPSFALTVGSLLFILSFILIFWVSVGGWWQVVNKFGGNFITYASGAFFLIVSSIFVTAGAYAAFMALPK